ncbi:Phosphatidylethanolamine N-methyltransferase Short=PEAMT [Serendipita indica DSM 11827]|nr:Phosphatidylethanolamine N-methyltransferase Short=PEAMT [Serendipita indica DSM 11827]
MEESSNGLRRRHVAASDEHDEIAGRLANMDMKETEMPQLHDSRRENASDDTVWGKVDDGKPFKVPTTHDVMTLFNPYYPKSHFDVLSLFLLGSQLVICGWFLHLHRLNPQWGAQKAAKGFFLVYFMFWRAMYDAGLGWVLTKQSKKKWIVNLVKRAGWFDKEKNPHTRAWLKRQLVVKMGSDYDFEDLPLEYNTWLLFRQVVDIILLNDFLSYVLFAICNLDFLFPGASRSHSSTINSPGMVFLRLLGGVALLLFNLWVKTSAHDVVKDYGWYWGDCFFSRGHLRKSTKIHDASGLDLHGEEKESQELHFDLVFDGIFEMAPHPMYSVGYAGYYGVSLLAGSYSVLFVSLAAHAAQFAFLNFFENPHIERRYGVRRALAERVPIVPSTRSRNPSSTTLMDHARVEGNGQVDHSLPRSRSVSLGTAEDSTAIDSDDNDEDFLSEREAHAAISPDAEIVASITPPNGVVEVMQEAVTQHDLLNKFFRKDVIILGGLDLLRSSDQLLVFLTTYILILSILPRLNLTQSTITKLHFLHAFAWRMYYSLILGLILKAQSESKFLVRHFLKNYHYAPLSLTDSPRGRGDRGVKEGAVREAFDNWKGMYNMGMVMCYVSFIGFALQTYTLPTEWTVGDVLLRHTVGALLIALHMWAAKETFEVLGKFGWFFGDFFIDDFPTSLNYTGIYRFLNNPERTLSGAALLGLALITGNKAVFALAFIGHFAHWGFLSWVEGPHMQKLYGDSLRKDAGLTKMLKKLARRNARIFEGIRQQLTLILEESSLTSKHAAELRKVAQGVKEVGDKIGEVYSESTEKVEEVWKRSRPRISEVVAETKTLIQQSKERFVIPMLARDLADYDQTKYKMYVIPTNPDGQLRFHWGEPIHVVWRSPLKHSRRDWVGIYRYGANQSQVMTKTSSLGLWVPVHDEEWEGDVPRPLTDRSEGEDTECGELVFKNSTLPWQTGEYELRYHHDGKYNVVALIGPIQVYLDRPEALDFRSIRNWLLKIVHLALDSDPSLVPRSQTAAPNQSPVQHRLPALLGRTLNASSTSVATATPAEASLAGSSLGSSAGTPGASYDIHDDDFKFWSERQAKRIAYAITQVLDIEFAPEVIVADANVTALTRRILASKELLGP